MESHEMLALFGHNQLVSGIYKPYGFCVNTDLKHFRLWSEQDIVELVRIKNSEWDFDRNERE